MLFKLVIVVLIVVIRKEFPLCRKGISSVAIYIIQTAALFTFYLFKSFGEGNLSRYMRYSKYCDCDKYEN